MVVRNQRFGTFSPFCLEKDSPPVKLTKYLLFILFTPQWVHIYPLEWIIWLHFMTLHCFWGDCGAKPAFWNIRSISSWNGFSISRINKISFVHPIYTPMGPYLSIGMDYLIAFHAFKFFEVMVVRNQCFGTFSPFRLKTDSPLVQLTKYLLCILFTPQWVHIYPLEWIIWLHFMTLHCFWGDGGAKPAFWDIQSVSS